jgi:hypothetical protein
MVALKRIVRQISPAQEFNLQGAEEKNKLCRVVSPARPEKLWRKK